MDPQKRSPAIPDPTTPIVDYGMFPDLASNLNFDYGNLDFLVGYLAGLLNSLPKSSSLPSTAWRVSNVASYRGIADYLEEHFPTPRMAPG